MTNESTCSCGKPKYIGREVCYDCYKEMFYDYKEDVDDEPAFELKHDVAEISASNHEDSIIYTVNNHNPVYYATIHIPKRYVFNKESRVKDYEALVEFLLANMIIYDDARDFNKVKYMFKEVGK